MHQYANGQRIHEENALVDANDEDRLVLLEESLELIEVSGLGLRLAPHSFGEV